MATITTEIRTAEEPAEAPAGEAFRSYRMTVEVYEKIVEAGVFGDKSPIFLWKGRLVLPMTKGPAHGYSLVKLHRALTRMVPDGWHPRQEAPTRVLDDSEPEPDLTVVVGSPEDYLTRTPDASDVALTIEVADSSLRIDSREKLRAYAAAAIPEYWVVNLPENRIDVYTGPTGPSETPTYAAHRPFSSGEEIPVVLDGREVGRVAVSDVLP